MENFEVRIRVRDGRVEMGVPEKQAYTRWALIHIGSIPETNVPKLAHGCGERYPLRYRSTCRQSCATFEEDVATTARSATTAAAVRSGRVGLAEGSLVPNIGVKTERRGPQKRTEHRCSGR
jgi:hypothetical protein